MYVKMGLMVKEPPTGPFLAMPEDIFSYCQDMKSLAQESVHVLTLNMKLKLINRHMVSLGTLNSSLLHPREVFRPAIKDAAASIILVHNHPSGDSTPSAEDIQLTRRFILAGDLIGIELLDHIIIGDDFHSIRRSGAVNFSEKYT
jgi:DNA repair protein RadC